MLVEKLSNTKERVRKNAMSFNEVWKNVYNLKQRVAKSNNLVANNMYNFTRISSKVWKNYDRILYIL